MSWLKTLDMEALMMSPIMAILALVASIVLGLGFVRVGLPLGTLLPLAVTMGLMNVVYFGTVVAAGVLPGQFKVALYLFLGHSPYPFPGLFSLGDIGGFFFPSFLCPEKWLETGKNRFFG